jgi:hypothetical protein
VIAPATLDAVMAVADALGFTMFHHASKDIGIDAGSNEGEVHQMRYRLNCRSTRLEFDGTARECAAFLIGWRDAIASHGGPSQ